MSDQEIYDAAFNRLLAQGENQFSSGGLIFTSDVARKDDYMVSYIRVYEKFGPLNLRKRLVFCRYMTFYESKKSISYKTLLKLPGTWTEKIKVALNA